MEKLHETSLTRARICNEGIPPLELQLRCGVTFDTISLPVKALRGKKNSCFCVIHMYAHFNFASCINQLSQIMHSSAKNICMFKFR